MLLIKSVEDTNTPNHQNCVIVREVTEHDASYITMVCEPYRLKPTCPPLLRMGSMPSHLSILSMREVR